MSISERHGTLRGVEAVIDKDLASALLADRLDANILLMLTDVDAVYREWGTPTAKAIRTTTPMKLRTETFAAGSMAPKIEAACRFVEATGRSAAIGSLVDAHAILHGDAGTRILPSHSTSRGGSARTFKPRARGSRSESVRAATGRPRPAARD